MASKKGIEAGQAYVKTYLEDSAIKRGLKAMRSTFSSFGGSLAKLGGGAIAGIGAGFAAMGLPLTTVSKKLDTIRTSLGNLSQSELDAVLKGTDLLAARYDADLPGSLEAIRSVMRNYGVDAAKATDIVVAGFEAGLNKSGDLTDTLNEYSPLFREMGLNAEQSLALLNRGMQAGARNTDFVADAVKEFNIRMRETGTAEGVGKIVALLF